MSSPKEKWERLHSWVEGDAPEIDLDEFEEVDDWAYMPETDYEVHRHHEKTPSERFRIWSLEHAVPLFRMLYAGLSIIIVFVFVLFLLRTVGTLPTSGNPENPANNEVLEKYITDGIKDTGAVNLVAGMILDYRAFDTFGESTVLFAAAGAVIILLRKDRKKKRKASSDSMFRPKEDAILQTVSRVVIPIVLMFGIYVVLNGHLSPGGGFSGGAVMGAALILYYNAYGTEAIGRFFTYRTFNTVIVSALGFYAVAKSYSFFTGANKLHSIIPNGTPGNIISSGLILPLNICVGVIVCCTMFGFYSLFDREVI